MKSEKAQINIEFIGGSILFFSALVFVISSIFGVLPQYENVNQINDLETTGIIIGKKLINDQGFWGNSTHNGSDWENHPEYEHLNFTNYSLGLAKDYHNLDPAKSEAFFNGFLSDNYTGVKTRIFHIADDFRVKATEFVPVRTYKTYEKGNEGDYGIIPPSDSIYTSSDTGSTIHFGNNSFNSREMWFLVAENNGNYPIYISDDKNFSSSNRTNASIKHLMNISGRTYIHDAKHNNEVSNSERNLLIFRREEGYAVGEFGRVPPDIEENYVKHERYVMLNSNPAKIEVTVW